MAAERAAQRGELNCNTWNSVYCFNFFSSYLRGDYEVVNHVLPVRMAEKSIGILLLLILA